LANYASFEFSIENVWRETLAFKIDERRRQRRKQSNQYVCIGFEWKFWNKNQFYPKIRGHVLIPNFSESENYQWACFAEGGIAG